MLHLSQFFSFKTRRLVLGMFPLEPPMMKFRCMQARILQYMQFSTARTTEQSPRTRKLLNLLFKEQRSYQILQPIRLNWTKIDQFLWSWHQPTMHTPILHTQWESQVQILSETPSIAVPRISWCSQQCRRRTAKLTQLLLINTQPISTMNPLVPRSSRSDTNLLEI